MLSRVHSTTLIGIDAFDILIEVDSHQGAPKDIIVGLADTVIKESRNRVKSAIRNSGFKYPFKVFTINLAPAYLHKEGAFLDLAIALGILHNTQQLPSIPQDVLVVGELSLNGDIRCVHGVVSMCVLAKQKGYRALIIPEENMREAQLVPGLKLIGVKTLLDAIEALENPDSGVLSSGPEIKNECESNLDMGHVAGQLKAKRALEIAATGQHNVLFVGPPGSGKTMLLKRLPGIMPPLTLDEMIDSFQIHGVCRQGTSTPTITSTPPFRSPHHSISYAGMVGGGQNPKPGEVSLAHHGVLFLDELAEFSRHVIEVLRQPLEDKKLLISRSRFSVEYPADFLFVGAMNPCPCGYYMDDFQECRCRPHDIQRYAKKISGPLLDRFDIVCQLGRVQHDEMQSSFDSHYCSQAMRSRVMKARSFHAGRATKRGKPLVLNGLLSGGDMRSTCRLDEKSGSFVGEALDSGKLTARSYDKVIKVARSIADLEGQEEIGFAHVLEAMSYNRTVLKGF